MGFINTFFNVDIMVAILPTMLISLVRTLILAAIVVPIGFFIGLVIAIARFRARPIVNYALIAYVDFFRSFPPLVLLILIYYGSPFLGLDLNPFMAAAVTMILNSTSYFAEVQRTGLASVPKGQFEAALATGMSGTSTYLYVVLPQALRSVLPSLVGNVIEIVKLTAIASAVSYMELLKTAKEAQSLLFSPTPLIMAALLYCIILWPIIRWLARYERALME